jgi:hypothetical protein
MSKAMASPLVKRQKAAATIKGHALSSPALRRRCCAGSVDVTRPGNRARFMADAICGLGPYGYIAAMDAVAQMAKKG